MNWLNIVPVFIRDLAYNAIAAEVNALTLPIAVPEFEAIKAELLAKIHAILHA